MQEEKHSLRRNNNKKWKMIGICALVCFCVLVSGLYIWHNKNKNSKGNEATGDSNRITVSWQGEKYKGIYDGKKKKNKPSGKGTFISDGDDFRYEGEWKNGKFHGEGKITYADGSYEEGKYDEGNRSGLIIKYLSDTEYVTTHYQKNESYGRRKHYKNGELTDSELIIGKDTDKEIAADAIALTTEAIKSRQYKKEYVYVDGTVAFVGENKNYAYFRIQSDAGDMVIGRYRDGIGRTTKQVYLPNMKEGDHVRIYGKYKGMSTDYVTADQEGYGYSYMEIDPAYGYLTDRNLEPADYAVYENRKLYPYGIYREEMEETFLIQEVFRMDEKLYMRAVPKDSEKDEEYVLVYKETEDTILLEGDTVKVKGYYDGQYKELSQDNPDYVEILKEPGGSDTDIRTFRYDFCPAIHVSEIE